MAANLAKAAAVGALASGGGGGGGGGEEVPECPHRPSLAKFHLDSACAYKPSHPRTGAVERGSIYKKLTNSGTGATLVPNEQTVVCPLEVQSLESESALKGFDTTWIVENTASTPVVIAWIVDGIEWSPFTPDLKPQDDPKAILQPGDWTSVPTFQSFVYHVREMSGENGQLGEVLLQHRAGMVPLGNPQEHACSAAAPDVEPVNPETGKTKPEFARKATIKNRPCNTIDVGFRNQVGCPLHVYWANQQIPEEVATNGFNCGERFQFHLGTKHAPQDFFEGWHSATKFEGTYIGHTFVARLASDPSVVIDSYTLQPTKVIDCPRKAKEQQVQLPQPADEAVAVVEAEGNIEHTDEQGEDPNTVAAAALENDVGATATGAAAMVGMAGGGGVSG